jgi:hypothetical protein
MTTISEFSRTRSNTICLPSEAISNIRVAAELFNRVNWRVFAWRDRGARSLVPGMALAYTPNPAHRAEIDNACLQHAEVLFHLRTLRIDVIFPSVLIHRPPLQSIDLSFSAAVRGDYIPPAASDEAYRVAMNSRILLRPLSSCSIDVA